MYLLFQKIIILFWFWSELPTFNSLFPVTFISFKGFALVVVGENWIFLSVFLHGLSQKRVSPSTSFVVENDVRIFPFIVFMTIHFAYAPRSIFVRSDDQYTSSSGFIRSTGIFACICSEFPDLQFFLPFCIICWRQTSSLICCSRSSVTQKISGTHRSNDRPMKTVRMSLDPSLLKDTCVIDMGNVPTSFILPTSLSGLAAARSSSPALPIQEFLHSYPSFHLKLPFLKTFICVWCGLSHRFLLQSFLVYHHFLIFAIWFKFPALIPMTRSSTLIKSFQKILEKKGDRYLASHWRIWFLAASDGT